MSGAGCGYSRRRFLGALAAGGAALATGCAGPGGAWLTSRPSAARLRLVFYTDVHARADRGVPAALLRAARAINAEGAELVLGGGDLIHGGFESSAAEMTPRWAVYRIMQVAIKGPHHAAIGNHDLVAAMPADGTPASADPRAVYRERLGLARTYYAFDAGGYHIVMLDSIEVIGGELGYRGFIGAEQMAWLKADLAALDPAVPIVVVTHLPLLTAFFAASEGGTIAAPANRVIVNNAEVLEAFRDHNLVLVLQGHLHVSELLRWRGTTFITGGAICGAWWGGAYFGTEPGFNVITLTGNDVAWRYVTYDWRGPERQAA